MVLSRLSIQSFIVFVYNLFFTDDQNSQIVGEQSKKSEEENIDGVTMETVEAISESENDKGRQGTHGTFLYLHT